MTLTEAAKLRREGHAINVAMVWDAYGNKEQAIITHYRTCEKCRESERKRSRGEQ